MTQRELLERVQRAREVQAQVRREIEARLEAKRAATPDGEIKP